jgi:polyisoprenoid-binding protein YceI
MSDSTTSTTSEAPAEAPVASLTREWEGLILPTPGVFKLDPMHTQIGFLARHMMVSKVRGRFGEYDGEIVVADDILQSTVEITIKVDSIDTREDARDNHLRSPDFFETGTHPEITFKSSKIEHVKDEEFKITGALTIKGISREFVLDTSYEGVVVDPYGGQRVGFAVKAELDRFDFGLTWNGALEAGGLVVGRKVILEFEIEAVRQA